MVYSSKRPHFLLVYRRNNLRKSCFWLRLEPLLRISRALQTSRVHPLFDACSLGMNQFLIEACAGKAPLTGLRIWLVRWWLEDLNQATKSTTTCGNSVTQSLVLLCSPDIVFIRTWYPVTVPNFCNPVTSLLLPPEQKATWQGMRTVGQLRKDLGLKAPVKSDSLYKVSTSVTLKC